MTWDQPSAEVAEAGRALAAFNDGWVFHCACGWSSGHSTPSEDSKDLHAQHRATCNATWSKP